MKRIKKLVSLMLAVAMVLSVSMTAFAADNDEHTITITLNESDKAEHTYEAYQIFAGDLAEVEGKLVLSNIIWGTGVTNNGAGILEALQAEDAFVPKDADGNATGANLFADCKTAADVAAVVATFASSDSSKTTQADAFATVVNGFLGTPNASVTGAASDTQNTLEMTVTGSGYYMVKDQTGSLSGEAEESAYTRFLLEVVGDATVTVKSDVPSGDKQVYVQNPDGTTAPFVPGDANYGTIGSHVSYVITSKVPNHVGYDYYYFIMNDTLSEGLTFDGAETVSVKVGATTLVQGTDYYVYTKDVAPYTFRLAFADIMDYAVGAEIVVTYSATVNDKAVIGTTGNPNTWNLEYSNNPNEKYDGTQDENKPGLPAEDSNVTLGETPDEITLTYLTQLDLTKYKNAVEAGNELADAEFTLTGTSYQVVLSDVESYVKEGEPLPEGATQEGTETYYLLKDGTYTTDAPRNTEYVEIGVGTSTTTKGYLKNADGTYYVPTDTTEYNGKTLYKLVRGTNEDYVDVNTKYVKVTTTETKLIPVNISMELTTGADGKISFSGLGAGEYTLTETVTPEGYNTLDPISFTIKFEAPANGVSDGKETCKWSFTSNTEGFEITENTEDGATGTFAASVINKSGSLLPSTGGIGTTIFYVVGTVLVLGAGILLVVRKRVSRAD